MSERAVAIGLKIPDNEAYTACAALRRLGVDVDRVERSEVRLVDDGGDPAALRARIETDESVFNPNKHALTVLEGLEPRAGEVWIEELEARVPRCFVGWRLLDATGQPVPRQAVVTAAERLLCNPAIENARFQQDRT
ncbi:MAG: hypothetical protein ACLQPV_05620 [Vulcanimicrobiaceae bacterium]